MMLKLQHFLVSLFLVSTALIVLLPQITKPFWGHHEFNGVFYSQIARNYLKLGLIATKGAQVTAPGGFHTHHPATYPLLLAGAYGLFGIHESVGRGLSILASLLGILLLQRLIRLLFPRSSPLLSLSLLPLILTPLFRYYARMPVFEPILFPLVIATLIGYRQKNVFLIFLFSLLSILVDWPGYWPALAIIGIEFVTKRNWRILAAALGSIALGTGLILLAQYVSYGHPFTGFLEVGSTRLTATPFTYWGWLRLLISRAKAFFSLPILITSLFGAAMLTKYRHHLSLLIITIFIGLAHILVFRNITWYHDYMLYHSLPLIGLTLAAFTHYASKKIPALLVLPILLALLVYFGSNRFYTDLAAMEPHRDCVQNTWDRNSTEKTAQCGPFILFYRGE